MRYLSLLTILCAITLPATATAAASLVGPLAQSFQIAS